MTTQETVCTGNAQLVNNMKAMLPLAQAPFCVKEVLTWLIKDFCLNRGDCYCCCRDTPCMTKATWEKKKVCFPHSSI